MAEKQKKKLAKPTFMEFMVGADKPIVEANRESRQKMDDEEKERKKRKQEDEENSAFLEKHGVHPSSKAGKEIKEKESGRKKKSLLKK
jgi:hypothetical protein